MTWTKLSPAQPKWTPSDKERGILRAALQAWRRDFGTWRAIRGTKKHALHLARKGLLKEAGVHVWGDRLYVITDAGRAALSAATPPNAKGEPK